MRFYIRTFIIVTATILVACIFQPAIDHVIYDEPFIINTQGVVFECESTLRRKRESAAIYLYSVDSCRFIDVNEFKCSDGTNGNIEISLIDSKGRIITAQHYGNAGDSLAGYFSSLPKNKKIKYVKISSSIALRARGIIWHQFNPI
jgi:hypothetical protein